jgi:type II secretory pathway pseudopilin PulG
MLVVIGIIGVLMATLLPVFFKAGPGTRDSKRINDVARIKDVIYEGSLVGRDYPSEAICINDVTLADYLVDFRGTVPKDPIEDDPWQLLAETSEDPVVCENEYMYYPNPPGTSPAFAVYAKMETVDKSNIDCDLLDEFSFQADLDPDFPGKFCYGLTAK